MNFEIIEFKCVDCSFERIAWCSQNNTDEIIYL